MPRIVRKERISFITTISPLVHVKLFPIKFFPTAATILFNEMTLLATRRLIAPPRECTLISIVFRETLLDICIRATKRLLKVYERGSWESSLRRMRITERNTSELVRTQSMHLRLHNLKKKEICHFVSEPSLSLYLSRQMYISTHRNDVSISSEFGNYHSSNIIIWLNIYLPWQSRSFLRGKIFSSLSNYVN